MNLLRIVDIAIRCDIALSKCFVVIKLNVIKL